MHSEDGSGYEVSVKANLRGDYSTKEIAGTACKS